MLLRNKRSIAGHVKWHADHQVVSAGDKCDGTSTSHIAERLSSVATPGVGAAQQRTSRMSARQTSGKRRPRYPSFRVVDVGGRSLQAADASDRKEQDKDRG